MKRRTEITVETERLVVVRNRHGRTPTGRCPTCGRAVANTAAREPSGRARGGAAVLPGPCETKRARLTPLSPADESATPGVAPAELSWPEAEGAALYRVEVEDSRGRPVLTAVLPPGVRRYRAPSWLGTKAPDGILRWRVVAFDRTGARRGETARRTLRIVAAE
ncbi:MAG: hypothetical protein ACRD68_14525 [Pyrinomonadaceae bacterium]